MLVTAAVLIGIGYTNFSSKSNVDLTTTSTNQIGDVQLVSSSAAVVENEDTEEKETFADNNETQANSALVSNDEVKNETEQIISSNMSQYFSELKMDRDEMYSKSLETYQKMLDSGSISSEQKSIAMQEIEKINNTKNAIQMAEELIKLKGFEDVVIYSSNDKISVIIRIAVLSDAQVAQIQNIVSKELGVEIKYITISNK